MIMIDFILSIPGDQKPFGIQSQLSRVKKLNLNGLSVFENHEGLRRRRVIEIIKSNDYTYREKFLSILLWGMYFEAVKTPAQKRLIAWVNKPTIEEEIESRFKIILSTDSPKELFKMFEKEQKIPGLGYAYFTKLFFFVRKAHGRTVFPILDKWLMRAYCAVSGSLYGNKEVYNIYSKPKSSMKFDGLILRKKSECYNNYVDFLGKLSIEYDMPIDEIEAKMFGYTLRQDRSPQNPRIMYLNWALANDLDI